MKSSKILAVAMALVVALCAGCETVQHAMTWQRPNASLKGLRLGAINLKSATLLFDVEVENPYAVPLPLLEINYTVTMGAGKLFDGRAEMDTTVPAKETATVSLPVQVKYLDLLAAVEGLKAGSQMSYQADAGLTVQAPRGLGWQLLHLQKAGQLTVPDLSMLKKIDWRNPLPKSDNR
ncbi:MAG: LEA/WHy family protein [Planctomycetota bacterium]